MSRLILILAALILACALFVKFALSVNGRNQTGNERRIIMTPSVSQKMGGGTISGRIVDSKGEPVIRERVYAASEKYEENGRYSRSSSGTLTDYQGNYRNLVAGTYTFRLSPMMSRLHGESGRMIHEALYRAEQTVVVSEENQRPITLTVNL